MSEQKKEPKKLEDYELGATEEQVMGRFGEDGQACQEEAAITRATRCSAGLPRGSPRLRLLLPQLSQ